MRIQNSRKQNEGTCVLRDSDFLLIPEGDQGQFWEKKIKVHANL